MWHSSTALLVAVVVAALGKLVAVVVVALGKLVAVVELVGIVVVGVALVGIVVAVVALVGVARRILAVALVVVGSLRLELAPFDYIVAVAPVGIVVVGFLR